MNDRRGLLIILSSPSGAGKSTLAKRLMKWDDTLSFSVSATTRAPREGEVDGKDYLFVTEDDFRKWVGEGEMLEHAHVFGNFYGSPKGPVEKGINAGRDVLFDIDWQVPNRSATRPWAYIHCRFSSCRRQSQSCTAGWSAAVRTTRKRLPSACRKVGTRSAIGTAMIMCW